MSETDIERRVMRGCSLIAMLILGTSPVWAVGDEGADGSFERRESFHFELFQDVDIDERGGMRGSRHFEQQVLRALEAAYDRLDDRLALRPDRKIEVYVWDPEIYDARFAGLFRFPAAGFYGGSIHVRGDTVVHERLVRVLHHELVHAALDSEAPNLVWPGWLNEGLAEWFEARAAGKRQLTTAERAALSRLAGQGALIPLDALAEPGFGRLSSDAAAIAYLQSYAFIEYLAREHGDRSLIEMWRAMARTKRLDRSLKRAFGVDLARLEKQFHQTLMRR